MLYFIDNQNPLKIETNTWRKFMQDASAKKLIISLFNEANIGFNKKNPWDIQVHNDAFYTEIINRGLLGLGETYMKKYWDCDALDQFFYQLIKAKIDKKIKANKKLFLQLLLVKIKNFKIKKYSLEVAKKHYDLGNTLFKAMLDNDMSYTCGYWKNTNNLDDAQIEKLKLSCEKLMLKPGMTLLDIGCGWGALAKYAAKNYGVHVVGITISKNQADYARKNCEGLPVEIRLQDYHDINEKFDRIISLGMFEHVGYLNYRDYMKVAARCLKDDGLFLLHTIGDNTSNKTVNAWTQKYIFPNSMLPSIAQIGRAIEGLFVMEDWHNFGIYYDKTLMAWHENFNSHWNEFKKDFDDTFFRMWNYYLLSSAGAFRARYIQLWQILFSKEGIPQGYSRIS